MENCNHVKEKMKRKREDEKDRREGGREKMRGTRKYEKKEKIIMR